VALSRQPVKPAPPSDDKRWKIVDTTMRRHGNRPDALIEALHTVQDVFGFLEKPAIEYVARVLGAPPSRVYGAATFYHFFTMRPQGRHTCVICLGTACYIKGAPEIIEALAGAYDVRPGQTTAGGGLSVLSARCLGACSLAPAVVLDGVMVGSATAAEITERVREWSGHDA
jgi:bidirectional [NiFe] hydrogenase diaphorase subunit